jgi:hypothetical protein
MRSISSGGQLLIHPVRKPWKLKRCLRRLPRGLSKNLLERVAGAGGRDAGRDAGFAIF